jgi:hypothetical protein
MAANITNAPLRTEISSMMASLDDNYSVVKGCRFLVRINLSGLLPRLSYSNKIGTLIYACEAAQFPGRGFQTAEVRYYGPKQMMPTNTTYGDDFSLTFLCRSKTLERQFFDDWMDIINPPNSYHFKYPNEYFTDIDIFQYAEYGSLANAFINKADNATGIPPTSRASNRYVPEPIYAWKMKKCWPVLVAPQQVSWAENEVLRLQVSFAFKNWEKRVAANI